ncbi:hypothetical protein QQ045_004902 [Rhodiola kirilowii]
MGPKKRKSITPDTSASTKSKSLKHQDPDLSNSTEHQQEPDSSKSTEQQPEHEDLTLPKYLSKINRFPIPCSIGIFQVEVPDDTGVLDLQSYREVTKESKWLGTKVWPLDGIEQIADKEPVIGRGRPDNCSCRDNPGSDACVKLHVSERRAQLRLELGAAFEAWKFDEMGEDVADSWNLLTRKVFKTIVEKSSVPDKDFLKAGNPQKVRKTRKEMISYYFNVLVPQRISTMSRAGDPVDSDNDSYVDKRRTTRRSQQASSASRYLRLRPRAA